MAKKNIENSICFPGEDAWELWVSKENRFGSSDYELTETKEVDDSGSCEPFKVATHYAFPLNSVFAVPVWVSTDNEDDIESLVELHLERTGLKPTDGDGKLLDYSIVSVIEVEPTEGSEESNAKKNLVLATVLNPEYRHPLPKGGSKEFDISGRFLKLPGDHIIVWKELGRLVMAVTHEGRVEYFEGLTSKEFNSSAVNEILCIILGLDGAGPLSGEFNKGISDELSGAYVWLEDVNDSVVSEFKEVLGLDVSVGSRPDPTLPVETSKLVPVQVAQLRQKQKKLEKLKYVILSCSAVYILAVAFLSIGYFSIKSEADDTKAQVEAIKANVDWIPDFEDKWNALKPTLDSNVFPAQLLHLATNAMPPEDLRFTGFRVNNGVMTIEGQSKDTNAAYAFYKTLSEAQGLKENYKWAWIKRPQVDPRKKDRTATFQIQSESKYIN